MIRRFDRSLASRRRRKVPWAEEGTKLRGKVLGQLNKAPHYLWLANQLGGYGYLFIFYLVRSPYLVSFKRNTESLTLICLGLP
jgi:hypothetical protein